ncbi:MAG: hypothetical protein JW963_01145 [Anaerolineales bacterium]|nr:hypothetical protein [Anaerolineales bacterium]
MKTSKHKPIFLFGVSLLLAVLACSLPGVLGNPPEQPEAQPITEAPEALATTTQPPPSTVTATPSPTEELPTQTPPVSHVFVPPTSVKMGKLIYDVVCVDTAVEQRAPYGDSYDINLFERPFTQDMSYIPDLDIASYNLSMDEKFYYVSIALVGANPNNEISIQYGVELDLDADGFGDYIVIARPPYSVEWSTDNVQVVRDTDHDTGGLSAEKSDAPLPGDGYDKVIFDGGRGPDDDDPDLAWVRVNAGKNATVQFAFKRGLVENRFMFGVIADAGLKEIADLDYVDRFIKEDAGSPIKGGADYPLKKLYAVDNTCWTAQGFEGNWEEPKRCPKK